MTSLLRCVAASLLLFGALLAPNGAWSPLAPELAVAQTAVAQTLKAPAGFSVAPPPNSSGLDLRLRWTHPEGSSARGYAVLRSEDPEEGRWRLVTHVDAPPPGEAVEFNDKFTTNPRDEPPASRYWYRVVALDASGVGFVAKLLEGEEAQAAGVERRVANLGPATAIMDAAPDSSWLNTQGGSLLLLSIIAAMGGLMFWFTARARAGVEMNIRRIPGIDAIEEGIGRATEMGRPVLYVPGIEELQDIQTIASMLILGEVAKTVAEYQSDIIVSCRVPMVREVADEVVRAGFYQAGYPDAYNPNNTRFISSEQFAFCAGTNGIMHRQKPATNIYLGRFFAESLILAETGYINKSIQIAGTAETAQLPFFVAACDYTLIGEELFAVSAYLSKDPRLVSSLKASDWIKIFCIATIVLGTIAMAMGLAPESVKMFFALGGG